MTEQPTRYAEYDDFAWFYDRYWTHTIPGQMLGALEQLLLPRVPAGARLLDLCCGTGQVAAALAGRGYRVTGVDGSEEMLRYARRNAPGARFLAADARDFRLAEPCDAAYSVFDSLNHLLSIPDLRRAFAAVREALAPGGLFVFDLNGEASFLRNWRGETHATVEADHVLVVRGSYDAQTRLGCSELTLFRGDEGTWRRSDVAIRERCYDPAEVRDALEREGFAVEVREAERELGMPAEHAGRLFFLGRAGW